MEFQGVGEDDNDELCLARTDRFLKESRAYVKACLADFGYLSRIQIEGERRGQNRAGLVRHENKAAKVHMDLSQAID